MTLRTLILLSEADDEETPDPAKKDDGAGGDLGGDAPKPPAEDDGAGDDPAAGGEGDPTDPAAIGDDEDDDLDSGGVQLGPDESQDEAYLDGLRRERLYDAISEIARHCEALRKSVAFVAERASDETSRGLLTRVKKIVDAAATQCTTIQEHFAELGYERVRTLYMSVRERVSAVAEIVEHVIDGDDDFRTDSGKPK